LFEPIFRGSVNNHAIIIHELVFFVKNFRYNFYIFTFSIKPRRLLAARFNNIPMDLNGLKRFLNHFRSNRSV